MIRLFTGFFAFPLLFLLFLMSTIEITAAYSAAHSQSDSSTWISEFQELHSTLSDDYTFTEWKRINWDSLYNHYYSLISEAVSENDTLQYIYSIRNYVFSIPDGHVEMIPRTDTAWNLYDRLLNQYIGGSYGLTITELDDGRIVAAYIQKPGSAYYAGMVSGAEIIRWNGQPVNSVLSEISEIWGYNPGATKKVKRLNQLRFLTRAPVGSSALVEFKNPGSSGSRTYPMMAQNDNYESYWLTHYFPTSNEFRDKIRYSILPSGYGYIQVFSEGFSEANCRFITEKFEEAVNHFITNNLPAIIVDLRRNGGGFDDVVPQLTGYFYEHKTFYEYISYKNENSNEMELTDSLFIIPKQPYFDKPVIGMVGPGCISSGEGVAMAIQNSLKGKIISFYGSNASFGMAAGRYELPYGFVLLYTNGRSLDVNKKIQLDSDYNLLGGVQPDIAVPLTSETVYSNFVLGGDAELEFVIDYLDNGITGVENSALTPSFLLYNNYPNPFNPETKIIFDIPQQERDVNKSAVPVKLSVFDILGNKIEELVNEKLSPGTYEVTWKGGKYSSGVYFYRLEGNFYSQTKKMILIK